MSGPVFRGRPNGLLPNIHFMGRVQEVEKRSVQTKKGNTIFLRKSQARRQHQAKKGETV